MRWARVLVALAAIAACKGSRSGSGSGSGSASIDWGRCEEALRAPEPGTWKIVHVIDSCPVCGDWTPILKWNVTEQEGGPPRLAIEEAMARCNAYCDANGKQRFLNNLDDARGTEVRTPWRLLGEICKAKISAVPDARYASAPLFALDRIARAVGARDPKLLEGMVVPLPAVTPTGVGVDLPEAGPATPQADDLVLTVLPNEMYLGHLPLAHLTPHGLDVDLGKPDPYPGTRVTDLHAQLEALTGGKPTGVTILASRATPAKAIADAVAAAGDTHATLALGVRADHAPPGWRQPATMLVNLRAKAGDPEPARIDVGPTMTVGDLAQALSKMKGEAVLVVTQ